MRLGELYKSKKVDISIELFPPKTEKGVEGMFQEVGRLGEYKPAFFSVTYGAAGTTCDLTLELADRLKNKEGFEVMCHLTVVGQSRQETRNALNYLKSKGIYNMIALRGDPPAGVTDFKPHPHGFPHAVDLVQEAKKMNFFSIAVAGFPELHPDSPNRKHDIDYLKKKVDAGADVIITQLFFDNNYFYEYLNFVRKVGIKVPVLPGILPILSVQQVRRFTALCKSNVPAPVEAKLGKHENDPEEATAYGIELATDQCRDLMKSGVTGIHFYCLNRSHSVKTVLQNLGL